MSIPYEEATREGSVSGQEPHRESVAGVPTDAPRYVCANCGLLGTMGAFQGECTPGWTHGRLIKVKSGAAALSGVSAPPEAAFKYAMFSGPHPSLTVDCPTCGAPAGCYCNDDREGVPRDRPHDARKVLAGTASGDSGGGESVRAVEDRRTAEIAAWLEARLEGPRWPGACVTVNLDGFAAAFPASGDGSGSCPGCGAPAGYPPAGPCEHHGTERAQIGGGQ